MLVIPISRPRHAVECLVLVVLPPPPQTYILLYVCVIGWKICTLLFRFLLEAAVIASFQNNMIHCFGDRPMKDSSPLQTCM